MPACKRCGGRRDRETWCECPRIGHGAPEPAAPAPRVTPEDWQRLGEMQDTAREVGEHIAEVRQRFGLDAPEPDEAERVWMVERRRTRPDGTTGEWRVEYYHRGPTPPDDPSSEYFERRIVEYVPATVASAAEARGRERGLEEAARRVRAQANDGEFHEPEDVARGIEALRGK